MDNENFVTNPAVEEEKPITGWNWGAFMFNWLWGIGNGTYLPLLVFLPFLNIVWPFVCAIKGNEWAYSSGQFKTVSEFNAVQKSWNRAGIASLIVTAVTVIVFLGFYVVLLGTLASGLRDYYYYY